MTVEELSELNVGEDLDQLMNLDPRGYGVCRILYRGTRKFMKEPVAMKCAKGLMDNVHKGDFVYIITGFILKPHGYPETDGIIGAMLLARLIAKAYEAKPIIICPEECKNVVESLAPIVGLHYYLSAEDIAGMPISVGCICFTKDKSAAETQAEAILYDLPPAAVIAIEAAGANEKGIYHNAKGFDFSDVEAKSDALYMKCKERGIFNMAIGDLGNEIGMGAIEEHLVKYIPFMGKDGCACGCGGGSNSYVKADNIITATISHWGAEAVIASTAWLMKDAALIHSDEMETEAIKVASNSGMVDMSGWLDYCIDGIDLSVHVDMLRMMRNCVVNALAHFRKCMDWSEWVIEKNYI